MRAVKFYSRFHAKFFYWTRVHNFGVEIMGSRELHISSGGDLLRVAARHKGKMTVAFLVVILGTAVYTIFSPRSYRSEAKLLLRLGRENVTLDPTATLESAGGDGAGIA